MGGIGAVNGTRRAAVERLSAVGRQSAQQAGLDAIAENLGQFRVKLGERGAECALARWVGGAAEMTGHSERGVTKEISDVEANSHFAIRLLSGSAVRVNISLCRGTPYPSSRCTQLTLFLEF
jgi:hypothetical protein